jgi:membrane protein, antimicrobial resistance system
MNDSSFGRLLGVLVAPGRTFDSIERRPTWAVALIVIILLAIGLGIAVHARTDYRDMMQHAMAGKNVQMSDAQMDHIVDFQQRFGAVISVASGVVIAVVLVVVALILWVLLKLVGSEIDFRHCLSVYLYGGMPNAVMMLIAIPLILSGGTLAYEQIASRNFLASNLAFLAPAGASIVVRAALAAVDFFALWSVAITALGVRKVAKVSPAAAWGVVVLMWVLGVGVRVGLAAMQSGGG